MEFLIHRSGCQPPAPGGSGECRGLSRNRYSNVLWEKIRLCFKLDNIQSFWHKYLAEDNRQIDKKKYSPYSSCTERSLFLTVYTALS